MVITAVIGAAVCAGVTAATIVVVAEATAVAAMSTVSTPVVTACEAVAHSPTLTTAWAEVATVIPAATAVHTPAVATTIDIPEMRPAKVEVVAIGVACIDAEVPVTSIPVERAVEIGGRHEGVVLPIKQDVAQVQVALCPIHTIEVGLGVDAHQVVKVHLVGGLILLLRQVELVGHLVGEEQCLLASLLVTHCACRQGEGQQCCHGYQNSFHRRKNLFVVCFFSYSHGAKEQTFLGMLKGFSLIWRGKIPIAHKRQQHYINHT